MKVSLFFEKKWLSVLSCSSVSVLLLMFFASSIVWRQPGSEDWFSILASTENCFEEVRVYSVRSGNLLVCSKGCKETRILLDAIEIERDVGLVLSPGEYEFELIDFSASITQRFELVLGKYIRKQEASDLELTVNSSQLLGNWLLEHGCCQDE